jgi:hypothetical protein
VKDEARIGQDEQSAGTLSADGRKGAIERVGARTPRAGRTPAIVRRLGLLGQQAV